MNETIVVDTHTNTNDIPAVRTALTPDVVIQKAVEGAVVVDSNDSTDVPISIGRPVYRARHSNHKKVQQKAAARRKDKIRKKIAKKSMLINRRKTYK